MISAAGLIAALDAALAKAGEDVVLRRVYGVAPRTNYVDLPMRAVVADYSPEELLGGIAQTDSKVILSPTPIANSGWPGGNAVSATLPDQSLPRLHDKIIAGDRVRNVEFVSAITVTNMLVRIELRISG